MSVENLNDGIISIGEPVTKPTGSLSVNRITAPNGPWVWELALAGANGERVGDITLTTVDLRTLHDLLGKALDMEQTEQVEQERCSYGGPNTPSSCRLPKGHAGLHERRWIDEH